MLLPPIGLFAVMKFYKKGYVNIYYGLYLALVFTIFSYVSTLYSINLDDKLLKKIFAIFTILTGFYMLFSKHMDNNC